jgi:hypothetical protein
MQRTKAGRSRPGGPAGPRRDVRLSLGVTGVAYLALTVGWLVRASRLTLLSYACLYPLKRRTTLSTLVGVPGALPGLGGWVAARGRAGPEAVLFESCFLAAAALSCAGLDLPGGLPAALPIVSVDDLMANGPSDRPHGEPGAGLGGTGAYSGRAGVASGRRACSSWLLWAALRPPCGRRRSGLTPVRRRWPTSLLFTIMMLDKVR